MDVFDHTTGEKVCAGCAEVNAYLGLMFQKPHPVTFSWRMPRRVSLHNCFVRGPLDVLFLFHDTVVEIKRGFRPWTFYSTSKHATRVIELPAGMAQGVLVGHSLRYAETQERQEQPGASSAVEESSSEPQQGI